MDTYLVGGAVRDELLGLDVKERDWVVVGATSEEMEAQGFQRLDQAFPVFQHPGTGEEYALARREEKMGPGHKGFRIYTGPDVTLEDDLRRRDLTINAIARGTDGRIIDPFEGRTDLHGRVLRHISPAFVEDPLRVLRVARFASHLASRHFLVAPATSVLMAQTVQAGELQTLPMERVWAETERALASEGPERFFEVLHDCGALGVVFPELEEVLSASEASGHHPRHGANSPLTVLADATRQSSAPPVRFSALLYGTTVAAGCLGKNGPVTDAIASICLRFHAPGKYRDLAVLVGDHYGMFPGASEADAAEILNALEGLDAFRRPDRFAAFLEACSAIAARLPRNGKRPAERLRQALAAASAVKSEHVSEAHASGKALGVAIRQCRIAAIARAVA